MCDATLLSERKPVARRSYRCIWCGQPIPKGEQYLYQSFKWEGGVHGQHWHFECADAQQEEGRASGDWEFEPYNNERPAKANAGVEDDPHPPSRRCNCAECAAYFKGEPCTRGMFIDGNGVERPGVFPDDGGEYDGPEDRPQDADGVEAHPKRLMAQ